MEAGTVTPVTGCGRPLWAIGDPGRAALEIGPSAPPRHAGSADVEISTATLDGMRVLAASVRGLMHLRTAEVRQDAFALGRTADPEQLVAVVCDGVGSLGRSHEASSLVSRSVSTTVAGGAPLADAIAHANSELARLGEQALRDGASADRSVDGMATTAIAMVVRREDDDWVGELAWVGDSSCWHLDAEGRWSQIAGAAPDEDENGFYTGRVTPLPSSDGACETLAFRRTGGALFLLSDGVANPLAWNPAVQDALAGWWAAPPDPLTFAAQVGFACKTHMDDRTAVGIWPGAPDMAS